MVNPSFPKMFTFAEQQLLLWREKGIQISLLCVISKRKAELAIRRKMVIVSRFYLVWFRQLQRIPKPCQLPLVLNKGDKETLNSNNYRSTWKQLCQRSWSIRCSYSPIGIQRALWSILEQTKQLKIQGKLWKMTASTAWRLVLKYKNITF